MIRLIEVLLDHSTERRECRMCQIHSFIHETFVSDFLRVESNLSFQRILGFLENATQLILNAHEIEWGD
jgi:hypothetical protein